MSNFKPSEYLKQIIQPRNSIPDNEDDDFEVAQVDKPELLDNCDENIDVSQDMIAIRRKPSKFSKRKDLIKMLENVLPSDKDDDFDVKISPKPSIEDESDAEHGNIDVAEFMAMLRGEQRQTSIPQNIPTLDEYSVAQYIMKHMQFICFKGQLYLFTYPGYEILDDKEYIARIKEIAPKSVRHKNWSFWNNVLKHITTTRDIYYDIDNASHPVDELIFANGCYNVYTKEFRTALPEDYITAHNAISFNPDNAGNGKIIEDFLEHISGGNKRIKQLIWTMIGAILSPTAQFKKFFYLYGRKDTGKSIIGNLCEFLVGMKNCSHIQLHALEGKYSIAQLHGKQLNCCLDNPATTLKNLGNLKLLTSGGTDTIETEKKYGTHRTIQTNQIKLLFASNHPLRIDAHEDVESFKNRVIVIPFEHVVSEDKKDYNLLDKLKNESDYIIKKAAKYYRKFLDNNLIFPYCERSEELLNEWFPPKGQETFKLFFGSDFVAKDMQSVVSCKRLYRTYEVYCDEHGYSPMVYNTFIKSARKRLHVSDTRIQENGQYSKALRGIKIIHN